MTEPTHLIVVSDLHINSTVALCTPLVHLDDGGTYHASRGQRWLWDNWLDFCKQAGELPGRKVVVINGDLGELDVKRRSTQLITVNKATIQSIVIDTIAPLLDICDRAIFIRGTMAHTGKAQWLEEAIAQDCTITFKANGTASWYHFQGMIGEGRYDIAHHAGMGSKPWTYANRAHSLAIEAELYYHRLGIPLPHVVYRSHNHTHVDSGANNPVRVIYTPAWSLKTEFVYRLGRELTLSTVGGMIDHKIIEYKPKEDTKVWRIKV